MYIKEIGLDGMDWIHLAQDRDRRCATMNTVMYIQVFMKCENFLTGWNLLASQEGLCFLKLFS
jgi:hypothetical protein